MRNAFAVLFYTLAVFVPSISLYGQDTEGNREYLSDVLAPVAKKKAVYYRERTGRDGGLFQAKTFSLDGKLKAEGTYLDSSLHVAHGSFVFYHPNGRVESRGDYKNGLKSGLWQRFDAWGEELAEKIYNPEPLANIVYTRAQTMPEFADGGERGLVRYVKNKVESLANQRVKGTYTTTFIVEKDGSLTDVKVVEGQDEKIGQQVVDAIRSSSPWSPGAEKGIPVRVQMRVPVQF